jgi:hypothetical protein
MLGELSLVQIYLTSTAANYKYHGTPPDCDPVVKSAVRMKAAVGLLGWCVSGVSGIERAFELCVRLHGSCTFPCTARPGQGFDWQGQNAMAKPNTASTGTFGQRFLFECGGHAVAGT